ncbi:MAG: DNA repair protein RecO [Saprospiraceae bacterium]
MLIKTKGIVFRTVKYGDSGVIVDIYTAEKGLQQYYLRGLRSEKSRFRAGLFQVMSILELEAYCRSDKALNTIREARPGYVYQTLPFDVRKGAVALFMAEVARKTVRETESDLPLFDFISRSLIALDQAQGQFANMHLHFLIHLSAYLGFAPSEGYSETTPCFDLQEGGFVVSNPHNPYLLDPALSYPLSLLMACGIENSGEVPIDRAGRNLLLARLLQYYQLHVGQLSEIQSHRVLQEVF